MLTLFEVFGGSTTQIFQNAAFALLEYVKEGDEMVLSQIDHEANIEPWVRLAARAKMNLKWWKGDPDAGSNPILTTENLKPLLSPKTKFVACTHTSNILGTIHDISSLSKLVHETCPDALFCTDAVAYAPHAPVDVQAFGVDLYAFSWYKVYGPHISVLYASDKAQKAMTNQDHYFNMDLPNHQDLASKLGFAASNYELGQSVPKVVEYLTAPGIWENIEKQEQNLQGLIVDWLKKDDRITIYGQPLADRKKRVPVISFTVKGRKSQDVVEAVEKTSNYGIRWGHFYSHRLLTEIFGLTNDGVIRISLVHYNTSEQNLPSNFVTYHSLSLTYSCR